MISIVWKTTGAFQMKHSLTDILEIYICCLGTCKYVSGLRLKNLNAFQHMSWNIKPDKPWQKWSPILNSHTHWVIVPDAQTLHNPAWLTVMIVSIGNSCWEAMMSRHTIRHVSADKGGTVLALCRHGPLPSSTAINVWFFCCYCCCCCLEACFGDWGEHRGLNPLVSQIATKEERIQQPQTHYNAPHEGGSSSWEEALDLDLDWDVLRVDKVI